MIAVLTTVLVSATDAGSWWNLGKQARGGGAAVFDVERVRAVSLLKKGRSYEDVEKAARLLEGCLEKRPEPHGAITNGPCRS